MSPSLPEHWRVAVAGLVQGVGFRPFVCRVARDLDLSGSVFNVPSGAVVDVWGDAAKLALLVARLRDLPPPGRISALTVASRPATALATGFVVAASEAAGTAGSHVPPDIATCRACIADAMDPKNRRYGYALISCAACGPRYSITAALPFDRDRTSMAPFLRCADCEREYLDPSDRRFHAQTIACPSCGPQVSLVTGAGNVIAASGDAVKAAATLLAKGGVVAVKGVGGFQLVARADAQVAVRRLRRIKRRPTKPFALLVASAAQAGALCEVDPTEAMALASAPAPIVLMRRRATAAVASEVAPSSPFLGCMLPASMLHHLLIQEAGGPLVATSANVNGAPICLTEREAFVAFSGGVDGFLVHDRAILRRVDDSVVRARSGHARVLRLGRGYAPLTLPVKEATGRTLAFGGQEKNALALTLPQHIVLSQHIGDLGNPACLEVASDEAEALTRLLAAAPSRRACDLHPDYESRELAEARGPPDRVQHHHAHVLSCLAEQGVRGPVLGVAWDGTGFGPDGTVWGGELLQVDGRRCVRVGALRPFSLPGGDLAVREPRRAALGLVHELGLMPPQVSSAFTPNELRLLQQALTRGLNCPRTSSVGRLFDAVAALLGLCMASGYQEQAPTLVEGQAMDATIGQSYELPFVPGEDGQRFWDWEPLVRGILTDVAGGVEPARVASGFHAALARGIAAAALALGAKRVVLTGGVFHNALLCSLAESCLSAAGISVLTHRLVPAGDGGLAAGQALYCALAGG